MRDRAIEGVRVLFAKMSAFNTEIHEHSLNLLRSGNSPAAFMKRRPAASPDNEPPRASAGRARAQDRRGLVAGVTLVSTHVEYLIIGAGPAGLQAAWFLRQSGDRYLVLERDSVPGSFFATYPRHRKLLSINKVYTGCPEPEARLRFDWNSFLEDESAPRFAGWSQDYFPDADALVRYAADFARRNELAIRYDSGVRSVAWREGVFRVETANGEVFTCDRLIVASGLRPRVPTFEGVELCDTYDAMPVDPAAYRDKKVIILGKGNSAFETAEALTATTRKIQIVGPKPVTLAWKTHFVGDVRAVNNNFLDTYHLKAQNNVLDGRVQKVSRDPSGALSVEIYFDSRKCAYTYSADHVILCTGFCFDTSIFEEGCAPEMRADGKLPMMTHEWESLNVPGLFFAGTLMAMRDDKKTMSSFIHGFRHNIEALDQIFARRFRGGDWRRKQTVAREGAAISKALIERLSVGADIFLQPGFLCDLLVVGPTGPVTLLQGESVVLWPRRRHQASQPRPRRDLTVPLPKPSRKDTR